MRFDWILIADDLRDLAALGAPFRMMTTRDYVLQPKLLSGSRPKIINLARNYNYQTDGYYASLLGEARGHRVIPTVETLLDLHDREIPDDTASILEELLHKDLAQGGQQGSDAGTHRGVLRRGRGRALPQVRPPDVRLVSGARGGRDHDAERIARQVQDQAHPDHALHQAGGRGAGVLRHQPDGLHRPDLEEPQGPRRPEMVDRRAARPEREAGPLQPREPRALGAAGREGRRRDRADHQAGLQPAGRVRRPDDPRDHLDQEPHLPLRPEGRGRRHAGDRRSDLDDPLHQQGLPVGAADRRRPARAGNHDHPGQDRPGGSGGQAATSRSC